MENVIKISEFTKLESNLLPTTLFPIVQNGTNYTAAISSLASIIYYGIAFKEITDNYLLQENDIGYMLLYRGTSDINVLIDSNINVTNYNVSVAQLSTGTVTIGLSNYGEASIISYGDLVETAGSGAVAAITRVIDDIFLVSGVLQ